MAWIVLLAVALVYLAALRYGSDSRDGLDWRPAAEIPPRSGRRLPHPRRSLRDDLGRLLTSVRSVAHRFAR